MSRTRTFSRRPTRSGWRWCIPGFAISDTSPSPGTVAALPTGTVTFLFTDIEGSTKRWAADPAVMRAIIERHDQILREGIEAASGNALLDRGEGDSFFAVFARPTDAVRAALEIQRTLKTQEWPDHQPVKVRMSIHTGEAGADYRGPDTNKAARIRGVAHGGQVVLSSSSAALARDALPPGASLTDLGAHRLKDLTRAEEIFQLVHPDLPREFPPLRSLNTFTHNLPVQTTSFVGRERELEEVRAALTQSRLLTLTGSGGSGKTRLALQVAAEVTDDREDGVYFVDLAPISDPGWVAATVAGALAIKEQGGASMTEAIVDHLKDRDALLLLDNCEHLLEPVAQLASAILQSAPRCSMLLTSREPIAVAGERVYALRAMAAPAPGTAPAEAALSDAVRLFVERAASVKAGFELNQRNVDAVVQICARLDGIPLAIELAAARVSALSADDLLARLEDRFKLLTGGGRTAAARQQTLAATLDWSHALLSQNEQSLFRRLSVFAGGWALDAAETIGAGEGLDAIEVLDLLAALVNKSLVVSDEGADGATRYRLLETMRQYARAKLDEAGEAVAIGRRHFENYLEVALDCLRLWPRDQVTPLKRLDVERDNLREALDWALTNDDTRDLELVTVMTWLWSGRGLYREGRERLETVLARHPEPTADRSRALAGLGVMALSQGDNASARAALSEAINIAREIGDEGLLSEPLSRAAMIEFTEGNMDEAERLFTEATDILRRRHSEPRLAYALMMHAQVASVRGDVERALALCTESEQIATTNGDTRGLMTANHTFGDIAFNQADYEGALARYLRGLELAKEVGDPTWTTFEIEGQSMVMAAMGRHRRAAVLAGAAAAQRESMGLALSPRWWTEQQSKWRTVSTEALGAEELARAEAEGRSLGQVKAMEYATDLSQD